MAGGEFMMAAVDNYLALRRSAGYVLSNAEYLLRSFARLATDRQEQHIRTATVIDWASQALSLAQRHTRYQTVCRFAHHVRLEDPRHELPPPNHFGYRKTRRVPHIYSPTEIDRLILAAKKLPPVDALRPQTFATLISLLAATGLRISEALHLLVSDVTPDGLLIRKTKFQKTRLVPLHETAVAGLRRYLTQRRAVHLGGEHVFVGDSGQPLAYGTVYRVFGTLLKSAGVLSLRGHRPRLHELRHTFAARALESTPAGRQRIGQHMLALATYLGHVNIESTYWYLESTSELLADIAAAGEVFLRGGQS
jgi:integrase/recombinase XerD